MNHPLERTQLLAAGCILFAAGMIAGAALAPRVLAPAPVAVARGDALATFAPDAILALTYATRNGITTLQRASRGARFHVQSTYADDTPVQRCTAPADLAGHLARLADMKARRGLSPDQRGRDFPVQLGVLDIRDNAVGEPAVSLQVFANREQSALAVILDGYSGEVILPAAELRWLERACDTVALSEPPAEERPLNLTGTPPVPQDPYLEFTTSGPGPSQAPAAAPSASPR